MGICYTAITNYNILKNSKQCVFIISERTWVSSVAEAPLGPLPHKPAAKTWTTLHSLLEAQLGKNSHSISNFLVVGGLRALAFWGLLAKGCPKLLVATAVPSGLLHSVVPGFLQPSLSLHQARREVSGSSLFRQILMEQNLTMAVISHHLGYILLDRSQLQVPPPLKRKELNKVKHQEVGTMGGRLRVCLPQRASFSVWAVFGFPGKQGLPL